MTLAVIQSVTMRRCVRVDFNRMRPAPGSGFSLIELLIVVVLICTLTGTVMIRIDWIGTEAEERATEHNLKVLRSAIDEFHADRRRYPSSLVELVDTRYLREVPVDPTCRTRDGWKVLPSAPGVRDVYDVRPGKEVRQ